MGTRADFYVGRGKDAEWIGSQALDGYRDGINPQILGCTSEAAFRHAVADFLAKSRYSTTPDQGWPWPWDTSATSDCSYWHFDDKTWDDHCGVYVPCDEKAPETDEEYDEWIKGRQRIEFPDMSSKKNVTLGPRSGLIVLGR
jgi:hypothetical protein